MAFENDQRGRGPDSEDKIERKPSRPYENRQGDDDDNIGNSGGVGRDQDICDRVRSILDN